MNHAATYSIACSAVLAPLLGGCASRQVSFPLERNEETVAADRVPAPARLRLEQLAAGNEISGFEREDRGNLVTYVAEWTENGSEREATVLADGSIIETERDLIRAEMPDIPPAIQSRARALADDGFGVNVALRTFVAYEIEAEPLPEGDGLVGATEDDDGFEILLRPDGTQAARER